MSDLRAKIIRLAGSMPPGNPVRRELLMVLGTDAVTARKIADEVRDWLEDEGTIYQDRREDLGNPRVIWIGAVANDQFHANAWAGYSKELERHLRNWRQYIKDVAVMPSGTDGINVRVRLR